MDTLVVYDVGGVLVELGNIFETMSEYVDKSATQLQQEYAALGVESDVNLGNTAAFYSAVNQLCGRDIAVADAEKIRCSAVPRQIEDMVALKEELAAKNPIAILSTTDEIIYRHVARNFPLVWTAHGGPELYSFREHTLKPDIAAYAHVQAYARSIGVRQVIYIEDKAAYLDPPVKEFGWRGIHYTPYQRSFEPIRHVQKHDAAGSSYPQVTSANELRALLQFLGVEV